jgi:hypothetical protein
MTINTLIVIDCVPAKVRSCIMGEMAALCASAPAPP